MKKYICLVLLAGIGLCSCDKTVSEPIRVAYTPVSADLPAGNWKTVLVPHSTSFGVPAPPSPASNAYQEELAITKKLAAARTPEQLQSVNFWAVGAVYRWHQIARELAAKYNLPPAANSQGVYPVPDPNNPLADPAFPFANPPYAARMFAYLGVAQYDALVHTWKLKQQFRRRETTVYGTGIQAIGSQPDLPAYPAEGAVVAQASFRILAAMFPGEVPYLTSRLTEALNAQRWSGRYVESDIEAGIKVGEGTAGLVMARAKTDGMGAANNQALVAGQIAAAQARGVTTTWLSQEIPARPPMLPNYGAVRTWNFSTQQMEEMRPARPYVAGSPEWNKELDELKAINKKQTREQARIANFWADGAGSYTPPGHWNRHAATLGYTAKLSEVKMARVMALTSTALMDAGIACWDTKYYYYTPRPQQFGIKTSVGLPNFPAFTSGHSTFSAAAATILSHLFPENASRLESLAKEASESRIYGLIHFRSDCEMGLTHGRKIGQYAVERAKTDGAE